VQRFRLSDTSSVECLDGGKVTVSLAALMLSYSGTTWYERSFGAKLEHGHTAYRKLVDKFLNGPDGKRLHFDAFAAIYKLPEEHFEVLRSTYDHNTSLSGFFSDLKTAYPCDHPRHSFCSLVVPWVAAVIKDTTGVEPSMSWIISAPGPDGYEQVGDESCCHFGPYGCCRQKHGTSVNKNDMTLPIQVMD
jgi:hypothetical protein